MLECAWSEQLKNSWSILPYKNNNNRGKWSRLVKNSYIIQTKLHCPIAVPNEKPSGLPVKPITVLFYDKTMDTSLTENSVTISVKNPK